MIACLIVIEVNLKRVWPLLILLNSWIACSQEKFPEMPKGFRMGMERELQAPAFAKIVHLFDFDLLQEKMKGKEILASEDVDDYMDFNPEKKLSFLSPEIRSKLTKGLNLTNVLQDIKPIDLIVEKVNPKAKDELVINNQLEVKKTDIITHTQDIKKEEKIFEQVQRRREWDKLTENWKALPLEEKKELIKWEFLRPVTKVKLALQFADEQKVPQQNKLNLVQLKKDIPEDIKKLFKKFTWDRDNKVMEFRHNPSVIIKTPDEFLKDAEHLALLTGTKKELLNPEKVSFEASVLNAAKRTKEQIKEFENSTEESINILKKEAESTFKTSLHYHVSIPDRDLTPLASLFNDRLFLKRISQGIISDLTRNGEYLYYSDNLDSRGLVRLIGKDRIEFRAHPEALLEELNIHLTALSLPPEKAGIYLQKNIIGLLDSDTLKRITKYNPKYLTVMLDRYKTLIDEEKLKIIVTHLIDVIHDKKTPIDVERDSVTILDSLTVNHPELKNFILDKLNSKPLTEFSELLSFKNTNREFINGPSFNKDIAEEYIKKINKITDKNMGYQEAINLFKNLPVDVAEGRRKNPFIAYLFENLNRLNPKLRHDFYYIGLSNDKMWNVDYLNNSNKNSILEALDSLDPRDRESILSETLLLCKKQKSKNACFMVDELIKKLNPKEFQNFSYWIYSYISNHRGTHEAAKFFFPSLFAVINDTNRTSPEWIEAKTIAIQRLAIDQISDHPEWMHELTDFSKTSNESSMLTNERLKILGNSKLSKKNSFVLKNIAQLLDHPDLRSREAAMKYLTSQDNINAPDVKSAIREKLISAVQKQYLKKEKDVTINLLKSLNMNFELDIEVYKDNSIVKQFSNKAHFGCRHLFAKFGFGNKNP